MLYIGVVVDNDFDNDYRVQKEIRLLQQYGHVVFVLCFDYGRNYKIDYEDIIIHRIRISKSMRDMMSFVQSTISLYDLFWSKHITEFVKTHSIEVLHVHDLYMSKAAHLAIRNTQDLDVKLTLDLHENYPEAVKTYRWAVKGIRRWLANPSFWKKKEPKYLGYADNIIVLSESYRKDLIQEYPFLKDKNMVVHPNIPDLHTLESFKNNKLEVNYQSDLPTLFYFGVVAQRRGILDVLPWIVELVREGLAFNILIIGPVDKADKEDFKYLLHKRELISCAHYLPWVDLEYLPAYLKKVDIGLAPFRVNKQHDSGVANKIYQYMFGRIPVLATPCKAQKELIEASECGLIYNNKEDFKRHLTQLVKEAQLRKTLGDNGLKALQELLIKEVHKDFLSIY